MPRFQVGAHVHVIENTHRAPGALRGQSGTVTEVTDAGARPEEVLYTVRFDGLGREAPVYESALEAGEAPTRAWVPQGGSAAPTRVERRVEGSEDDELTIEGMRRELRGWGVGLMVLGVVHLFIPFLDPVWGIVIMAVGALNLLLPRRGMFIVNGIALLLVGLMNIFGGGFGGFTIFSGFQIFWGVQEFQKFPKYESVGNGGSREDVRTLTCPTCSAANVLDAKFCRGCGRELRPT